VRSTTQRRTAAGGDPLPTLCARFSEIDALCNEPGIAGSDLLLEEWESIQERVVDDARGFDRAAPVPDVVPERVRLGRHLRPARREFDHRHRALGGGRRGMSARGSNVVNLFPPASPAEREELLEFGAASKPWARPSEPPQSRQIDLRIEAETNPVLKVAFAGLRDIVANADQKPGFIRQNQPKFGARGIFWLKNGLG
jgi:hypothetical protein